MSYLDNLLNWAETMTDVDCICEGLPYHLIWCPEAGTDDNDFSVENNDE